MRFNASWVASSMIVCVLVSVLAIPASAKWKEKVLYSFQGGSDGQTPAGGVVFDQAGNLYGATTNGGSDTCPGIAECGTVFQLQAPVQKGGAWAENVLYVFKGVTYEDGETPAGGVIFDKAGNLYGTTAYGGSGNCKLLGTLVGCGVVFEMTPPKTKGESWTETVLYSFQGGKDGDVPQGDLVFDSAGNLYGATLYGGGYGSCNAPYFQYCGVIFQLSPPKTRGGQWKEKVLYSFKSGNDGANPNGGLVFKSKGTIYGTTYAGGNQSCRYGSTAGCGTAFKLKAPVTKGAGWKETLIHRFSETEGNPSTGVTLDETGYIYGTSLESVFRIFPSTQNSKQWKEEILYKFNQNEWGPAGALIFDQNGYLYGTTNVGGGEALHGSAFQLKPLVDKGKHWTFTLLHGFLGPPDGDFPAAKLIFDGAGNLYSTSLNGGTSNGCGHAACGTVFQLTP